MSLQQFLERPQQKEEQDSPIASKGNGIQSFLSRQGGQAGQAKIVPDPDESTLFQRGIKELSRTMPPEATFGEKAESFGRGLASTAGGAIKAGFETLDPIISPIVEKAGALADFIVKPALDLASKPIVSFLNSFVGEEGREQAEQGIKKAYEYYQGLEQENKDLIDSFIEVGSLIPLGRGVKTAGKGARVLAKPIEEVAEAGLRKSAQKGITEVLAPTKVATKRAAQKIVPELTERVPVAASREALLKTTKKGLESVGKGIDEFIESGAVKGSIDTDDLIKTLQTQKEEFTFAGVPISSTEVRTVDALTNTLDDIAKQFPDRKIPALEARKLRQAYDKLVAKDKGFLKTLKEGTELDLQKKIANGIREQLAKQNPDLAVLNSEYSFLKNLEFTLAEAVERKTGQTGVLKKAARQTAGAVVGSGGGAIGAVAGAAAADALGKMVDSTLWKTVSAKLKTNLANALAKSEKKATLNAVEAMMDSLLGATAATLQFDEKVKKLGELE